jgi:hypothetical protein
MFSMLRSATSLPALNPADARAALRAKYTSHNVSWRRLQSAPKALPIDSSKRTFSIRPRINDRRVGTDGQRFKFTSRILPPYMRRSPKVAEVLPVLYLRGLSTGDFREALAALLGEDAAGLSATNIARLTDEWETEYVWVDGVHFNVRLEDDRLCTLVMIGVRPGRRDEGADHGRGWLPRERRELEDGAPGPQAPGHGQPVVAIGDGALGFWAAVRDVWPKTCEQRDWFHKLGNILDKLPKRLQPRLKAALHEIMYAEGARGYHPVRD